MLLNCRRPGCRFQAQSTYVKRQPLEPPTHEWYKPKYPERYESEGMKEHVKAGGLVLRKIGDPDETEVMKPDNGKSVFGFKINVPKDKRFSSLITKSLTNKKK
ncbi:MULTISPECIES: hypothetical protein [unclassified Spirosoma]|uniref:hypothetical protein n=1 Tax=unclassified Spirosoma TaxID=2621999 RepID=UPI001AC94B8B|nr:MULTISPECIES: hypothetical protein [unclassified Spirosoma]MBN8826462.1 hypothetical protein [Spirosoma sp.]